MLSVICFSSWPSVTCWPMLSVICFSSWPSVTCWPTCVICFSSWPSVTCWPMLYVISSFSLFISISFPTFVSWLLPKVQIPMALTSTSISSRLFKSTTSSVESLVKLFPPVFISSSITSMSFNSLSKSNFIPLLVELTFLFFPMTHLMNCFPLSSLSLVYSFHFCFSFVLTMSASCLCVDALETFFLFGSERTLAPVTCSVGKIALSLPLFLITTVLSHLGFWPLLGCSNTSSSFSHSS